LREALVAVDVVGLRYREAARALGIRETTLTTRHRARQRVAQALRPQMPADQPFPPRLAAVAS
jgi:RNA polymerase sigma-70 factor, ECF subfamily